MPELSPLIRAQHVAELGFLQVALQRSGRDDLQLVEHPADGAPPHLVVSFGNDEVDRPRDLHVTFVPLEADDDDGGAVASRYIELFVPLPLPVAPEQVVLLQRAIAMVNEHLAIGRFGLSRESKLYYRYVLAAPAAGLIDDEMFVEVVAFVEFHQDHFTDYLEGVLDDEISLDVLHAVIDQTS